VLQSTPVHQQQQQQQPPQAAAATPAAGLHTAHSTAAGSGALAVENEGLDSTEGGGGGDAEGEEEVEEGAEESAEGDDAPLLQPQLHGEQAARGLGAGSWAEHEGGGEGAVPAQEEAVGAGSVEPAAGSGHQHQWVPQGDEASML